MSKNEKTEKLTFSPLRSVLKVATPVKQQKNVTFAAPVPTADFLALREKQVLQLSAVGQHAVMRVAPWTKTETWPDPSPTLLARFEARPVQWKDSSKGYLALQRRLLGMCELDESQIFATFERICFVKGLAPTTALCYWVAFVTLCKSLSMGYATSFDQKRIANLLEKRATVYPSWAPAPMQPHHLIQLMTTFGSHPVAVAIRCAWTAGQRIGDFLQLGLADIKVDAMSTVAITVRRGKTVASSGQPYTFPLADAPATRDLIMRHEHLAKTGRVFLFSQTNSVEERAELGKMVAQMLATCDDRLEQRSIRRGGLQAMGAMNVPLETIRCFSQHKDVSTLLRYLSWGALAGSQQGPMTEVTRATAALFGLTTWHN